MSYGKQNFKSGDILYASQLNAMDEQIADNERNGASLKEDLTKYEGIFTANVDESVSNWLDEHPEATIAVRDNTISKSKLTDALRHDIYGTKILFMPVAYYNSNAPSGDCSVIISPNKKIIMIDSGSNHSYELIKAELQKNNISHIDFFVLSHYHPDHYGNIENLINDDYIDSNTVSYLPKLKNDVAIWDWGDETVANSLLTGEKYYPDQSSINIDGIQITFLNCNSSDYAYYDTLEGVSCNNYSMCCLVKYKNTTILFAGDILKEAQRRLTEKGLIQHADILKIPHHGWDSNGTTYDDFYLNVNPNYSIVSVTNHLGEEKAGHYSRGINYINALGGKVYTTGKGVCKAIITDTYDVYGNGVSVETSNNPEYQIHVNSNSTEAYTNGSFKYPFRSLINAINFAKNLEVYRVRIVFDTNYVEENHITISNCKNVLYIDGFTTSKKLLIYNSIVVLDNLISTNSESGAIEVGQDSCVYLNYANLTANCDSPNGVLSVASSKMVLSNCEISNKNIIFDISNNSNITARNLLGTNNQYLSKSMNGTEIAIESGDIQVNRLYAGSTHGDISGIYRLSTTSPYVIYKDDAESSRTVQIDLSSYNRKMFLIVASDTPNGSGGLYLVTAWVGSISINSIAESTQVTSIKTLSGKKIEITHTGIIEVIMIN